MPAYQLAEHRYTDRDVRESPRLYYIAQWYAENYAGDFEFMRDMMEYVQLGNELNVSQVRAVMNCLRNDPHMAARVPDEVVFSVSPDLPEHEFKNDNVVKFPKAKAKKYKPEEPSPCLRKSSHNSHWWWKPRTDDTSNKDSVRCVGVPFLINRKDVTNTFARVRPKYIRARNSGVFHKVQTKFFGKGDFQRAAEGFVSWHLAYDQVHEYGYGVTKLHVHTECKNPGTLQQPALYYELPNFEELSELLGIETRRCKRCFPSEDS